MLFAFADFQLDTDLYELRHQGAVRAIQPRSLDLLIFLIAHRDRVVTKTELLTHVWRGVRVTDNAVAQSIASLRESLGEAGPSLIINVRSRGYRFNAHVVDAVVECVTNQNSNPSRTSP
jgi:DNA-binding winged helix-turn-helix (wHTH) protein